jgi:hypothetical protein
MCPKCEEKDNIAQAWESSCHFQTVQKNHFEKRVTLLEALVKRLLLTLQHEDELAFKEAKRLLDGK